MRAMLVTLLSLSVLLPASWRASAEETPAADPPAPESTEIAESHSDVDATARQAAADKDEEFRIPPGFRVKKRGKFTLYCRKEEVMGTRFASEKCYDETGIREMLLAQKEDQEKVDQLRRICGSQAACGGGS